MKTLIKTFYSKMLSNLYTFDYHGDVTRIYHQVLFIIGCSFPKLKSLSEIIRFRYGNHALKLIKKYEKHNYRLRNIHLGIAF